MVAEVREFRQIVVFGCHYFSFFMFTYVVTHFKEDVFSYAIIFSCDPRITCDSKIFLKIAASCQYILSFLYCLEIIAPTLNPGLKINRGDNLKEKPA